MIKQLLNSVIAKYRDLSVSRRSIICLSLRLRQIIDLLATEKSRYFAQPRPIIAKYSHVNSTYHEKSFALSLVLKVRGFGIRKWPIKREFTKTKKTYHRNINNVLVSLTCDLEISAVAESSIAPFSTNTPSPVIHVTQQITCNFHYRTRWLSSLSLWIKERRNHLNESYCGDVMLFKEICE